MPETAPIPTPIAVPKEVMSNVEGSQVKKNIQRKKHPHIVNMLKQSIEATTITKYILDLGVNFTIGKLLVSAPHVEKQLTKAISKNEAV